MTRTCRRVLSCAVLLVGALSAPAAPLLAQNDSRNNQQSEQQLERLRRDQNEILRKAERLRALMDRLLQRYERENKQEQVDLLRAGLQHLDRASMVKDVASIRDDLAANAFSEALRKQQEVVTDIERLLNILLQRRSIENLDEEIQQTAEMAATARELERLQAELRQRTDQATRTDPNETERAIEQLLDNLAREQIAEAAPPPPPPPPPPASGGHSWRTRCSACASCWASTTGSNSAWQPIRPAREKPTSSDCSSSAP